MGMCNRGMNYRLPIGLLVGLMISCQSQEDADLQIAKLSPQELTDHFCGACHLMTDPSLLDKETWRQVLPTMRHFMGLRRPGEDPLKGKGLQEGLYLGAANVFPSTAQLDDSLWHQIEMFILSEAPDTISLPDRPILTENQLFKPKLISPSLGGFPAVCMVDFDTVNHLLYVGDINGFIAELDSSFAIENFSQLRNPIVKCLRQHDDNELLLLDIGILDPIDLPAGAIVKTDLPSFSKRTLVFEELSRPVDFALADLDLDGRDDVVVCGFGHLVGDFSWFRNTGNQYQKVMLSSSPGSIKVKPLDVDDDGDQDLMVLFAHGDEGLHLYRNDGYGRFRVDTLLRFHALFGSTDFALEDMNADGLLDVILTNGDNSDQSQILKSFHGVRVFLNQGDFDMEESYFFAMHGAYKILAHDFDLDQDIDLMAIAFHPDYQRLDQSIIFLENQGAMSFVPSVFDLSDEGRWMVMDAGDVDRDGDQDVIIGSFVLGPGHVPPSLLQRWRGATNHLLYLENETY